MRSPKTSAQICSPRGWSTTLNTAVAWVWSMNLCGRKACSITSTEGFGARASIRLARSKAGQLDGGHVDARGLDAQHLDFRAERIAHRGLERRVAAAMQHKLGVAAQQTCRIDAQ